MAPYAVERLGDVLANAETSSSRDALFLPMDEAWTLDTPSIVTDLDAINDPASEAINADGRTYQYALGIDTLIDVIVNAREQAKNVSRDEILEAFLYYYDHDAFIAFAQRDSAK